MHQLTEQNVRIAAVRKIIPDFFPQRYETDHMRHAIADLIVRDEMVTYKRADADILGHYELTATLGVVDPTYVKTMQERIRENQLGFAEALVSRVFTEIEWFGQNESITKSVAKRIVMDVLLDMKKNS